MTPAELQQLSPDQKRVRIAEAVGLPEIREIHPHGSEDKPGSRIWVYGRRKDPAWNCRAMRLPDYLNDLNAMHEAEQMAIQDKATYERTLRIVVNSPLDFSLLHATAAQRADAFLLTI